MVLIPSRLIGEVVYTIAGLNAVGGLNVKLKNTKDTRDVLPLSLYLHSSPTIYLGAGQHENEVRSRRRPI